MIKIFSDRRSELMPEIPTMAEQGIKVAGGEGWTAIWAPVKTPAAEIERMRTEGPRQADLDKVKANWMQNYRKSLQDNGYWLAALQTSLTEGTDPATILTFDKEVQKLSVGDLKLAAQRYLKPDNYVQVVLNPEKAQVPAQMAAGAQKAPQ